MDDEIIACLLCQKKTNYKAVWGKNREIVECKNCGFMQSRDTISPSFGKEESETVPKFRKFLKERHLQIAEFIANRGIKNALEIGSGYGGLAFLSNFNSFKITCIEPDKQRWKFIKSLGLENVYLTFDEIPDKTDYDAVILDNVLEHVSDPHEIIQKARDRLNHNGLLLIIVPNRYDIRRISKTWSRRHFYLPDHHYSYFKPSDLDKLLSHYGFKSDSEFHYGGPWLRLAKKVSARMGLTIFGISKVYRKEL